MSWQAPVQRSAQCNKHLHVYHFVGNVWAIEMQLNQSFFVVEWPVESMWGPIPFSVESTAVERKEK